MKKFLMLYQVYLKKRMRAVMWIEEHFVEEDEQKEEKRIE